MLTHLNVEHFTRFAEASLRPGALTVIFGPNGSGKTHLLKLAWAAMSALVRPEGHDAPAKPNPAHVASELLRGLNGAFRTMSGDPLRLTHHNRGSKRCGVSLTVAGLGELEFTVLCHSPSEVELLLCPEAYLARRPVYLPPGELMTLLPEPDDASRAALDLASLETLRMLSRRLTSGAVRPPLGEVLDPIEQLIGGQVIPRNGQLYVSRRGQLILLDRAYASPGSLKLGMIARLLKNSELSPGSTLLWDAPDVFLDDTGVEVVAHAAHLLASVGVQVILATHSQLLYDALLRAERRPQGQPMRLLILEPQDQGKRHVVIALNPPDEEDAHDDSDEPLDRDLTPPPFAVEPRPPPHRQTAAKNVRPDRRRTRLPSPVGAEPTGLPAVAVDDRPIIDRGPVAKLPRVSRPRRGRPPRAEVEAAMEAARAAEALAEVAPRQKRRPGEPSEPLIADGGTRRRGRPPKEPTQKIDGRRSPPSLTAAPIPTVSPSGAKKKGRRRSNKPPVIPPAPIPVEGAPPAPPEPLPEPVALKPWSLGDGNVE
jgi:energy-coupling factor transporter ATP-binding protein EcfA2